MFHFMGFTAVSGAILFARREVSGNWFTNGSLLVAQRQKKENLAEIVLLPTRQCVRHVGFCTKASSNCAGRRCAAGTPVSVRKFGRRVFFLLYKCFSPTTANPAAMRTRSKVLILHNEIQYSSVNIAASSLLIGIASPELTSPQGRHGSINCVIIQSDTPTKRFWAFREPNQSTHEHVCTSSRECHPLSASCLFAFAFFTIWCANASRQSICSSA